MNLDQLRLDVEVAHDAAREARRLRRAIRRQTIPGSERREKKIEAALERLAEAMRPIRSARGQSVYLSLPYHVEMELIQASQALQAESAALRRMRRRHQ